MIFTSEQVSCGHPDKICDQISDAIVTDCLAHDKRSRVAAECMIKDFDIIIAGEITSSHTPDYEALAREVLKRIGVFGAEDFRIQTFISKQSADIALGVDGNAGAGDQGMMFGYATNETPEMLPIPYAVATHALQLLREVGCPILLPDAKSQVSYDYESGRITTFLISTQHLEGTTVEDIRPIVEAVMETAAQDYGLNTDFEKLVNPTGRFVVGSSFADSGLTGRKIIADTYGGMCRHGGGAFSGKDPTKVDRSGAYVSATLGVNCGMSTGRNGIVLNDQGGNRMDITDEVTCTLRAESHHPPCVMDAPAVIPLEHHPTDSRIKIEESDAIRRSYPSGQ